MLSLSFHFVKLSNAFVFLDPESPIINFLYGWSGIYGHLLFSPSLCSFVIQSKLNVFYAMKMSILDQKGFFKKLMIIVLMAKIWYL